MIKFNLKSQGEIFGVALLFVLILLGFLLYTQFKDDTNYDSKKDDSYKILADTTLNSLLKTSSNCYIKRSLGLVEDLVYQCIYDSFLYNSNPYYSCGSSNKNICSHSKDLINKTLLNLYNTSNFSIGPTPYELRVVINDYSGSDNDFPFHNEIYTNFGSVTYLENVITKANYRKYKYKRVSSKPITFKTIAGDIEFELYLYYR